MGQIKGHNHMLEHTRRDFFGQSVPAKEDEQQGEEDSSDSGEESPGGAREGKSKKIHFCPQQQDEEEPPVELRSEIHPPEPGVPFKNPFSNKGRTTVDSSGRQPGHRMTDYYLREIKSIEQLSSRTRKEAFAFKIYRR
jgi:hypothetical protein